MSAAVIALPTAALAPVIQQRRRGRLPSTVNSLSIVRMERQRKRDVQLATYAKESRQLCHGTLERIMDGEVTGVLIIEAYRDGTTQICVNGEFLDKRDQLQRTLDYSSGACARGLLTERNG